MPLLVLELPQLLIVLPQLLQLPHYYIQNIEGKFELNQMTLCPCIFSKEPISFGY